MNSSPSNPKSMASQQKKPHFLLLPFMAPGRMIPMTDMAKQFAQHGVIVTLVTTPLNASRIKAIIDRAIESNLSIQLLQLPFPSTEAGLPEGCENFDTIPSRDLVKNFFAACGMLQQPLEELLERLQPRPSCIISDKNFPWTSDTAIKFKIPRLIFHGTSCFSLLCTNNILLSKVHENVPSKSKAFVVPGMPDQIELTVAQLPESFNQTSSFIKDIFNSIRESESKAYGVVVNTFEELEPEYIEGYKKAKGKKVWSIGPVSQCNKERLDKVERGNKSSIDQIYCLKWLDSKEPNSIVYVCLGSLNRIWPLQLIEIGLGLEASKRPFIWVVRGAGDKPWEFQKWLSEERFEERTEGRGLLIQGWAPQVLILSHRAIGGFLTHCGWNSTMEGVCSGVPMITWPLFAEQFFNEKFIVQVLRIGIRVGVETALLWGEEERFGVLVKREEVKEAVDRLMDEGKEGEDRRKRAKELRDLAGTAIEERGSSHFNITLLLRDIMLQVQAIDDDQ